MEWKIGEIKQVNGEWYQCVEGTGCYQCAFNNEDNACQADNPYCLCRSDKKKVVFKKLEKVGEPYEKRVSDDKFSKFQRYKVYNSVVLPKEPYIYCNFIDGTVEKEIKQTKEDMEEMKLNIKPFSLEAAKAGKPVCTRDGRKARIICFDKQEGLPIVALVEKNKNGRISEEIALFYINGRAISADIGSKDDLMMLPEKKKDIPEFDKVVDECLFGKNKLKPFNIQKAKSGKPVCTRDGRKARIICFDRMDIKPVVALVTVVNDTSVTEKALYYFEDGHHLSKNDDNINDLMMLPEKKSGWMNLYRKDNHIITSKDVFCSEGGAIECVDDEGDGEYYISTIKISWEE